MRVGRAVMLVMAAAFFAACTTGDPASPMRPAASPPNLHPQRDFASGSRLHARAWDVDGLVVLRDFFDTLRAEPCAFQENGVFHSKGVSGPSYWCLPLEMARHDEGVGPYSDPDCLVPVGVAPVTGRDATYVSRVPADACASPPVIHQAGPPRMMHPWVLDRGICIQALGLLTTYAIGEPIPLDAFVRAEEHVEDPIDGRSFTTGTPVERETRVATLVLVGSDGARQTISGFDRKRSAAAQFEDPGNTPPRWVPSRVAFQGAGDVFYGDDKCTMAVPTKLARNAVCPLSAVRVFLDACGHASVHEIGAPLDRSLLHDFDGPTCVKALAPGTLTFELGPEIAPSDLPPGYMVEVGGDVVRRRAFTSTAGSIVTWGDLVDVATKEACSPETAIDTTTRCLPTASADVGLFSDDACTLPAFAAPLTGCERGAPPRFVRGSRVDGEQGARVFEVTGAAGDLFTLRSESCVPFTPVVESRGFAVKELPPSRFPLALEREISAD